MDAKTYLIDYSKKSNTYLRKFFTKRKKVGAKIDDLVVESLRTFEDYSSGGKKLRGALTILGYQLAGGKNLDAILPVSCGIELLHNFLLIHDDIIDKDDFRRGKVTLHRLYSKRKGEHFGISKAIVVGDIGALLGYELIMSSQFSKEKITRALSSLNDFLLKTMYGQMLDIEFDFKKKVSWNDILKVRTYKTAYYTLVMPLTVGAILAGVKGKVTKAIERYGLPVGIAFQLADDILGVFGSDKRTGKSNESDIREGKKTLLFAKALELAKKRDREFLVRWYGAKSLDKEKIEEIREIMRRSGSLEYSKRRAKDLVERGKKYISEMTTNVEAQKILSGLADFVVNREK